MGKILSEQTHQRSGVKLLKSFLEKEDALTVRSHDNASVQNDCILQLKGYNPDAHNKFLVQARIKHHLEHAKTGINKGYYLYDADTTFLQYAKLTGGTAAILFLTDPKCKNIFVKYLDQAFLEQLDMGGKDSIRIRLTEEDCICDSNALVKFIKTIHRRLKEQEAGQSPQTSAITVWQRMFDRVNEFWDGDFFWLKKILYPNVWKFGVAYTAQEPDRQFYGIIPIPYGQYAPVVQERTHAQMQQESSGMPKAVHCEAIGGKTSWEYLVNQWLAKELSAFFRPGTLPLAYMPDTVLFEIIFQFLDQYVYRKNRFSKDREVFENIYQAFLDTFGDKTDNKAFALYQDCILQLQKRNITIVKRIWKSRSSESLSLNSQYYGRYQTEEYMDNLQLLYEGFPALLEDCLIRLFGAQAAAYLPARHLSITFDLSDHTSFRYNYLIKENVKSYRIKVVSEEAFRQLETSDQYERTGSGRLPDLFGTGVPYYTFLPGALYACMTQGQNLFGQLQLPKLY